MIFNTKNILPAIFLLLSIAACKDPWEDRTGQKEDVPKNNIMEEISNRPELSQFALLLQQTGWDTILKSTKSFTVFAPTNDALAELSSETLADEQQVKRLVNNHICFLQYEYFTRNELVRVKSYNNKYLTMDFVNGKVDDANLITPYDVVANNGILHIIDKPLVPLINVWEFIENTSLCPKLTGYINSLTGYIFDPKIATRIGVDPQTGKTIYDTASGMVWNNLFNNRTRDLKSEEVLSTVVLFSDEDFDEEYAKFRKYFSLTFVVDNSDLPSDSITKWKIVKDIVFPGQILPIELPTVLKSTFGVNVPIGSFTIDSSFRASNGMVYIVSNYRINLEDKIPVIIIEGEDTTKYVGRDPFGQTGYTRKVALASGGYDFILDNHGANPGTLTYRLPDICNTKYSIYLKSVNDFNYSYRYPNDTTKIRQNLGWASITETKDREPVFGVSGFVPFSTYPIAFNDSTYVMATEKFISDFTLTGYNSKEWIQLRGTGKNATIALDYIKLVPIFQ